MALFAPSFAPRYQVILFDLVGGGNVTGNNPLNPTTAPSGFVASPSPTPAGGTFPDRIVATASYHAGGLATDDPGSPHLLAPKIRSRVYIGGAARDSHFPDEMKERLREALTNAGVDHKIETFQAEHGWVFRDIPSYDLEAAERHWQTVLALFDSTVKVKSDAAKT